MGRITYTIPAGAYCGRRREHAAPGRRDGGRVAVYAEADTLVDLDLDDNAMARLAAQAVANRSGRATAGPVVAQVRRSGRPRTGPLTTTELEPTR